MIFRIFVFFLICIGLLRVTSLSANDDAQALSEFDFQTLLLAKFRESPAPKYYYQDGEDFRVLTTSYLNLGMKHRFRGELPFRLYKKVLTDDGEVMQVVATLPAKVKAKRIILVMIPRAQRIQLNALAVDNEALKPGQLLLLNASKMELAMSSRKGISVTVPVNDVAVLPYSVDEPSFDFNLKVAASEDGKWALVHSSIVTQTEDQPLFAIAFQQGKKQRWNIRFLRLSLR